MQKRHTVVGLCFAAVFICYIDRVNISVAIIAMQEAFGWSDTVKGLVLSSFFIGYMILQAPAGWLGNRFGGKRILGGAVLWWSVFTLITPVAAMLSLPALIAARIGMGLGEAATFPASYSLFGRWVPDGERARSVGLLLSGIPLGTLFALTTTGWLVSTFGWPSVFYLFGATGVVWTFIWMRQVSDSPANHPGITAEERTLLAPLSDGHDPAAAVPWRELLSHRAVWALIVNHFCSNWGLYVLLAWLPSYFADAQGLTITRAGIYSAAPWLSMFIAVNVAAAIADRLMKGGHSIVFVRKLMQSIGLFGSAGFLLAAQTAATPLIALGLMCGALGCIAFTWSGYAPNHLDIAPRYADILMGISNTVATIPGIIGVAIAGWLVDTTGSYAAVFALAAGIQITGAIVWLAFARGDRLVD